jgi:hypothetical protein
MVLADVGCCEAMSGLEQLSNNLSESSIYLELRRFPSAADVGTVVAKVEPARRKVAGFAPRRGRATSASAPCDGDY